MHVARAQSPCVAQAIAVMDRARQNIGDGFNAAMWMPRKPATEIFGTFIAEIIEQKEGIKFAWVCKPESAMQMNTCTFHCWGGVALF